MSSPSSLFGGNSDDSARMEEWLRVMCHGCVSDRGWGPAGGQGGMSCKLPADACTDPHASIPEWSPDGAPVPERVTAAGFTVTCTAYQPRSDAATPGNRTVHAAWNHCSPWMARTDVLARDHALSGALTFTAVAPELHVTGAGLLAGDVFTACAATAPRRGR